jgi:hypothetical protein
MKIIIIRYQSGLKEAIEYNLDALDFLELHFEYIEEIEIIEIKDAQPKLTVIKGENDE